MVESQPSKLLVASSILVSRSSLLFGKRRQDHIHLLESRRRIEPGSILNAAAEVVEMDRGLGQGPLLAL